MTDKKIGIAGIGLMGLGIATNIQKNGWQTAVLDHPGNQPVESLLEAGATLVRSGAELAARCEVVIICVTGTPEVEDVLTRGDGVLAGIRPNTVVIDCSTAIPSSTVKLAHLVETAGGRFLDAPMTRTPKEAALGRLNLIVGGDRALFEEMLPLFRSFAESIDHAGEVGAGHSLKLLHNFVSLGFSAVLAEAYAAANKAGISPATFHEILAKGGGKGVVLDRMSPYFLHGDLASFQFSLSNCAKDTGYYSTMSHELGASSSMADAICQMFQDQVDQGNGERFVPELATLIG
jgi:3-hydroxyisobutyrate dehydrogenase-like beta-hydroxyacid dehydrogenase